MVLSISKMEMSIRESIKMVNFKEGEDIPGVMELYTRVSSKMA